MKKLTQAEQDHRQRQFELEIDDSEISLQMMAKNSDVLKCSKRLKQVLKSVLTQHQDEQARLNDPSDNQPPDIISGELTCLQ